MHLNPKTNKMNSPYSGKEMPLKREPRVFEFRKEKYTIQFHYYLCEQTGEEFESQQLAELNHAQVVNQYRAKHHIPFTEEIINTRKKYGLSARQMSQILGFGVNMYSKYEQGEIPSVSNGTNIVLASSPDAFKTLIDKCTEISASAKKKVLETIQKEKSKQTDFLELLLPYQTANINNGFRTFSKEKFANMVTLFAATTNTFKVKLNKLLYYADFAHYKYFGSGISGASYEAIQMGPVPTHFQTLFEILKGEDTFEIEDIWFESTGTSGEKFHSQIENFNKNLFTETELQILKLVVNRFKDTSTKQIKELSHQEIGWQNNIENRTTIAYDSAFELIHL